MGWEQHLPEDVADRYEVFDYRHASLILAHEFPDEFADLARALCGFRFAAEDIVSPGGNESTIPKKFSNLLRPHGWEETQLNVKMVVDGQETSADTHKIDYVKGRIAFDLEWNSKDQTFDRDLYAFRAFFEYKRVDVAVLVTRSDELNAWFGTLETPPGRTQPIKAKYGASTTHMGKLIPRLEAGRSGGCPVLALGITTRLLLP